jgi:hypothetical protein
MVSEYIKSILHKEEILSFLLFVSFVPYIKVRKLVEDVPKWNDDKYLNLMQVELRKLHNKD